MGVTSIGEKGSDTKNAKHPSGRSGFWCLTPFRDPVAESLRDSDKTQQSCWCPPWKGGPTIRPPINSQSLRGSDFRDKAECNVGLGETDLQQRGAVQLVHPHL